MSNNLQRNTTIDVGRFVAAFLVVCLHTYFPVPIVSPFVADFGKVAVPFFFMVSGYYLYSDSNAEVSLKLKKNIPSLLKIIFQAGIVYAILRLVKHYYFKIDISDQNFNLIPFLLFNDFKFTEHLWYLFSFLYVLVFLWLLSKFKLASYIVYGLPIFLILHFVFTIWSRTIPISGGKFWMEFNWLIIAFPFVTLGMFCKKHLSFFKGVNKNYLGLLMLILTLFTFAEHYAFKSFLGKGPGVFSVIALSFTFFIYSINDYTILSKKNNQFFADLGKKHSLNIYLYHVAIREVIYLLGFTRLFNNCFVIFTLSLFVSIALDNLKKYTNKSLI